MAKKKKAVLSAAAVCFAVLSVAAFILTFRSGAQQRNDFRRISSEEYDTVFLSMYPIDNYSVSDFSYYRGMTVLKADHVITGFSQLKSYLKRIASSGQTVTSVYLGIRPDRLSTEQLSSLQQYCPSATFELILSYPSAAYWQSLSESEYKRVLKSYQRFLTEAADAPGIRVYFYAAEEWLIANPALYDGFFSVNADAAEVLFTNSDFKHPYMVTSDNAIDLSRSLDELTASLRSDAPVYPNLADYDLIFFGDSVFGNYTDDMSIPGAVRALTGATVYNCGYGGNSAAMADDIPISLPGIAKAFFDEDLSLIPADRQIYQGFTDYFEASHSGQKTCFIINYGLNDYFRGFAISSADPLDITTYSGAIRAAVAEIKKRSTDSQIILCTPSYSPYVPREFVDSESLRLQDYADAVFALAEELDVDVLDFYYTLGIDADTYGELLLPDLVHPNAGGRFLIAQNIIPLIR
ncbi:MAG: GDSL-type esterase/lipase family protein [Roseburia sp.]|nr:GDSL-type esterase/lipase family protein [Roseburia sp.]MCM1098620.1 GDSL-type esterase/lipase family protein [Ruminococcus flavefaciens]